MEVLITIVLLVVFYIVFNFTRGTSKVKNAILEEVQATKNGDYDYHLIELNYDPKKMAEVRVKDRISILVNDRTISTDDILPNKLDKYYYLLIETMQKRKDYLTLP